jgi:hypothetical protein
MVGSGPFPSGSKPHTAAKAETMDYAPAGRHAFDSRPRCRSRSAAGYPAPHRRAPATRSRKWSVQRPSLHNIYQKAGEVNPGRHLQSTLTEGLSSPGRRRGAPPSAAFDLKRQPGSLRLQMFGKNSVIPTEAKPKKLCHPVYNNDGGVKGVRERRRFGF